MYIFGTLWWHTLRCSTPLKAYVCRFCSYLTECKFISLECKLAILLINLILHVFMKRVSLVLKELVIVSIDLSIY